jgi:hypothetical protein
MPKYEKSKDSVSKACKKTFYDATKGDATCYLFLWFDPVHGFCYGSHIITGSEERKDPFSSAYLYMPSAPK